MEEEASKAGYGIRLERVNGKFSRQETGRGRNISNIIFAVQIQNGQPYPRNGARQSEILQGAKTSHVDARKSLPFLLKVYRIDAASLFHREVPSLEFDGSEMDISAHTVLPIMAVTQWEPLVFWAYPVSRQMCGFY